jgi:hypothetical protein
MHDETESATAYFWAFPMSKKAFSRSLSRSHKRQNTLRPIKSN